ncbi:MAG TPA: ABC transporter substrate-binding protein [Fibrobacteraceae bacterium]|nr:ABC transporter substrate-binding protein [Fibrobacteraceae bacterium]
MWRIGMILCLAGLAFLCGCHKAEESGTRAVTDMFGRTVSIPQKINRVMGTGGAVDEWILLLGHPEKLVVTSMNIKRNPWFVMIYPPILKLPAFTSFSNEGQSSANKETILSARPEVAIFLSEPSIENIGGLGIPALGMQKRSPQELQKAIRITGEVLGEDEKRVAKQFCDYYDSNMARILSRTQGISHSQRPRVYQAGGNNGLNTAGKENIVTVWIEMAGGVNVAAEHGVEPMSATASMEDLLRWDPEIIIVSAPEIKTYIQENPAWTTVTAVRQKRIYVTPKGVYMWGVRAAEEALQVLWAGKTIHPELFPNLDMAKETWKFHHRFYHYDLSAANIQHMLLAEPPEPNQPQGDAP